MLTFVVFAGLFLCCCSSFSFTFFCCCWANSKHSLIDGWKYSRYSWKCHFSSNLTPQLCKVYCPNFLVCSRTKRTTTTTSIGWCVFDYECVFVSFVLRVCWCVFCCRWTSIAFSRCCIVVPHFHILLCFLRVNQRFGTFFSLFFFFFIF